jgi:hypothetical protein
MSQTIKESRLAEYLYSGSLHCPKCDHLVTENAQEGWVCPKCPHLFVVCEKCANNNMLCYARLLNWSDGDEERTEEDECRSIDATWPPNHVGEPFKMETEHSVGDSSQFYWKCDECNNEWITDCD